MASERTSIADSLAPIPPITGELKLWTPKVAHAEPELLEAVAAFGSVDTAAGREASRWLREKALPNDPSTRTYLIVDEGQVEGFFACCAGTIRITQTEAADLGVAHYPELPAFLLAWIARRGDGSVTGEALMLAAYGLARWLSQSVGMVAFALDPLDDKVAAVWEAPPYGLQRCKPPKGRSRPPRLYAPLTTNGDA